MNSVLRVRDASSQIDTGSRELTAGNLNLAQRTESTATSLEQTAASMEEITATVKLNADNAGQAHQLAQSVSDTADHGSEMVCYVIEKMRDIAGSSARIADILSVIDGIAFQTNILALNASVEAARAGEQGRGFAVVAGEVRNLASRSADAAKEIRSLISDSQTHVNEGSELAQQAGETMDEIATEVLRMTKLMREIATASQEQSRGIEQVNIAVNQMDETAQQNAALVQQSSAATRSPGGTIARADGGDGILQTDGANGMIKIGEPVGLPYLRVTRPGIRGSCVQRLPPCGRCRQRTNGAGAGFPARYPEYALYRHSLCRLPVRRECHRVALVQQTQFSVRVAGGAWVEVNTALQQVTVEIRHQRADIARGVRALGGFILFPGRI